MKPTNFLKSSSIKLLLPQLEKRENVVIEKKRVILTPVMTH